MWKTLARTAISAFLLTALAGQAARAADAARGADSFDDQCGDCHTATQGGKNGHGPNLFGIIGRRAGTVAGFDYSDANKNSGVVWSATILDPYLTAPNVAMPGTAMRYKGMPDPDVRADIIAFLATLK